MEMELVFTMDGWRKEPGIKSKEGKGAENALSILKYDTSR